MYLVDTHVLLWLLAQPDRLGVRTRASLESAVAVHVSSVSMLELAIKSMTGRLTMPPDMEELVRRQGLASLPLRADHAAALTAFPQLARHDPFDRALLAQAQVERLVFLTADAVLLGLGLEWVLDATD